MTNKQKHQFGTFAGVFTPSILTILGVIMFMRTGFVVGQAGIRNALLILLLAEGIAVLTALSMAGIATNTPVKGGGAYFLISRVLGPEFGGAIGLALFAAQALSVPFYVLGFTEALLQTFPVLAVYRFWIASGTVVLLFILNVVGAGLAVRMQFFVLAALLLGVISFMGGAAWHFDSAVFAQNWAPGFTDPKYSFWTMFALFFPAVTGIMAGVNMSGDLKNPSRSLVHGTFLAVAAGATVYGLQIVLCGGANSRGSLIDQPFLSLVGQAFLLSGKLVFAGVFAATISSALGSFLGAPRVLQALARDHIVPGLNFFGKGTKSHDEPRRAVWLTFVISLVVIYPTTRGGGRESFDVVASVVAMFFLCTYGMINLAAFVESFGANPSFRPSFKLFHWTTALLGAIGCLAVMVLIDWSAAVVALVLIVGISFGIRRSAIKARYGDARRGFLYHLVSRSLWSLSKTKGHPKNWRPALLVLSGNPVTRAVLVKMAVWLEARRGIVSVVEILAGPHAAYWGRRPAAAERLSRFMEEEGYEAYSDVVAGENIDETLHVLMQAHSVGPIKPNAMLFGWPSKEERFSPFCAHIQNAAELNKSVLCLLDRGIPEVENQRIDIWWRGKSNGSLMLILAYMLRQNWEWRHSQIRLLRLVEREEARQDAFISLQQLIQESRIQAEASVVVSDQPLRNEIQNYSRNAGLVLMGFERPDNINNDFVNRFNQLTQGLPTVLLVCSNGEADLSV